VGDRKEQISELVTLLTVSPGAPCEGKEVIERGLHRLVKRRANSEAGPMRKYPADRTYQLNSIQADDVKLGGVRRVGERGRE